KPFRQPELLAAVLGRQRLWRVGGLRNLAVAGRVRQRQPAGADEEEQQKSRDERSHGHRSGACFVCKNSSLVYTGNRLPVRGTDSECDPSLFAILSGRVGVIKQFLNRCLCPSLTRESITETNGQLRRRTLATQRDGLAGILDGLSEGLNEAVADAVKGAVGIAVKEALQTVLTEVLAPPALLEQLQPPTAPEPAPPPAPPREQPPTPPASLLGRVPAAGEALGERMRKAAGWARLRLTVLLGVAGVAAAAAGFLFRPRLTLLAGWVAGRVSALLARLGLKRAASAALVT